MPERSSPRADARRSVQSILSAAIQVLNSDPRASMEAIALAAGVSRQTIYAHFPSKEYLARGVLDHITFEALAAIDTTGIEIGSAAEALLRLLEASNRIAGRYRVLLQALGAMPLSQSAEDDLHAPVMERLQRIVRRGQSIGEFDAHLPVDWVVTATIKLGHAAGEKVAAGEMSEEEVVATLRTTLLRILVPNVALVWPAP